MSVQDPIAFAADDVSARNAGSATWRHFSLASLVCLAIVFAWSSQAVNAAQIVAAVVALSIGLSVRAVMKLDEIDRFGLGENAAVPETMAGTAVIAALGSVSMILASTMFAPFGGIVQFMLFVGASAAFFAAAMAVEAALSALTCFVLKPLLSQSAIGAEIAVMLNLQQKFQTKMA